MHFITLQHFIGEIFGIPENVPRFLKNVFHIPDERQLGLASLGSSYSSFWIFTSIALAKAGLVVGPLRPSVCPSATL